MNEFDFNEVAKTYRSIHDENIKSSGADSTYFSEFKVIKSKDLLGNKIINQILDLGCGDGLSEVYFNKHLPDSCVIGVDKSDLSINVAKKRNLKNAVFYKIDDLKNGQFKSDLVFIANVLHHVAPNDLKDFLKKSISMIAPNGEMHIYEHNPYNPMTRKLVKDCVFDKGVKLLSFNYLNNILNTIGSFDIQVEYILFFPRYKIFSKLTELESVFKHIPLGAQYVLRLKLKND